MKLAAAAAAALLLAAANPGAQAKSNSLNPPLDPACPVDIRVPNQQFFVQSKGGCVLTRMGMGRVDGQAHRGG